MANTIRIKRSASTNVPSPTLSQGELANSEAGSPNGLNELYIGISGATQFKLIRNLNGAPAEPTAGLAAATPVTGDYMVFEDVDDSQGKRVLFSATPLSIFNNDAGWTTNTGTVTGTGSDNFIATWNGTGAIDADANSFLISNAVDKSATEIISGTWTLDGVVTTSDFGTGGRVKDGTDVERPIGFNVMPVYEIDADDAFDLAHNGFMWHRDAGTAVNYTCNNDATIPVGATYCVFNEGTDSIEITAGTASVLFLASGAAPTSGSVTVEQGGIVTVYKYSDTEFWVWGDPAPGSFVESVTATASGGITVAGSLANPTVGVDYLGTNNFIDVATNLEGVAIDSADTIIYHDASDNNVKKGLISDLPFGAGSGDISRVDITAGIGLTGSLNTVTGDHIQTIDCDFASLTDMTAAISGTTEFILNDAGTESRKAASEIKLETLDYSTWLQDDDTFASPTAVNVASSESIKAYVDNAVSTEMTYKGAYNASTNTPPLDTGSPAISVGDMYYVSVAGTFFATPVIAGDVLIANTTSVDAASAADWDIIEGMQTIVDASETTKGVIEIANQGEVDAASSTLLAVVPNYLHNTTFDGGTF